MNVRHGDIAKFNTTRQPYELRRDYYCFDSLNEDLLLTRIETSSDDRIDFVTYNLNFVYE